MASVKAFIRVSSSKKKIEKEVAVRFTNPFCHRKRLFFTQNQDWYYEEQK